ncbi:MAG: prepilin-type N-terminal cleavage/methylation domain-containing protein [Bryobacteraceae bacterium]
MSVGRINRRGITLIELVVVLTIIGITAAISFPAFSAGLDSVRLASATQSVASFLNGAVSHVERRQQPVEVAISLRDNSLTLYSNEPGFPRELKMPDGVSIEAVLPPLADETETVRRIVFLPGGAIPGIGIQIANQRGGRRIVRLDPMTGFPRVESVPTK